MHLKFVPEDNADWQAQQLAMSLMNPDTVENEADPGLDRSQYQMGQESQVGTGPMREKSIEIEIEVDPFSRTHPTQGPLDRFPGPSGPTTQQGPSP